MNVTSRLFIASSLLAISALASAHDPAEHAKEAAEAQKGPDCAAMQKMDHSKMDMNDPVMKAMMTQCAGTTKPAEMKGMDHSKMAMPKAAKPAAQHHDGHEGH